ncbi:MAG: hypothetical protein IT289_04740 [Oligoflexia bacterium]|nr:hypothetical protein [Oligoflexia bacterium]
MDFSKLQYYIIPTNWPQRNEHLALYNKAYIYWRDFWAEVLRDLGSHETLTADTFVRQDIVTTIMNGDEIVAVHLYDFFKLDCQADLEHTYISENYPKEFIEKLNKNGARTAMSMEFLTIDKNWRKQIIGFQMSSVLLQLGLRVLIQESIDAAIAPARNDLKMSQMSYTLGFECIIPNVIKHNVSCDLVACFPKKVKNHPDQTVSKLIGSLWENRIDLRVNPQARLKSA